MRFTLSTAARVAALFSALALTSCGGAAGTTFELTGDDETKYNITSLEATAPATITLKFKNIGKMPKLAMGHNVVVLKPGIDPDEFAKRCMEGGSVDNGYLPPAVRGDVIAHTKLLGPGESDSITFELTEAGTYPYVCTFLAHADRGMKGEIVVK